MSTQTNIKQRFSRLHLEVSGACNLRCSHCYNAGYVEKNKQLSTAEIKRLLYKAKKIGCKTYGFSGGEPFCRKDMLEIIKMAGDPIIIFSNGYLLTDGLIEKIKKLKKTIEFRISWEGYLGQMKLRHHPHELVLKNIKKLIDAKFIVTINTSLIRYNVDELMRMYNEIKNLKIDRWRIDSPFLSGSFVNNASDMAIRLSDVIHKLKKIIIKYLKEKPNFELDVMQLFRSRFLKEKKIFLFEEDSHPCAYQRMLTIRPDGGVSYCATWNKIFGNLLEDEIVDIVNSQDWQNFQKIKIKDLDSCKNCRYLRMCGGGCRGRAFYLTNNIMGADPIICEMNSLSEKHIWPLLPKNIQRRLQAYLNLPLPKKH